MAPGRTGLDSRGQCVWVLSGEDSGQAAWDCWQILFPCSCGERRPLLDSCWKFALCFEDHLRFLASGVFPAQLLHQASKESPECIVGLTGSNYSHIHKTTSYLFCCIPQVKSPTLHTQGKGILQGHDLWELVGDEDISYSPRCPSIMRNSLQLAKLCSGS